MALRTSIVHRASSSRPPYSVPNWTRSDQWAKTLKPPHQTIPTTGMQLPGVTCHRHNTHSCRSYLCRPAVPTSPQSLPLPMDRGEISEWLMENEVVGSAQKTRRVFISCQNDVMRWFKVRLRMTQGFGIGHPDEVNRVHRPWRPLTPPPQCPSKRRPIPSTRRLVTALYR